VHSQGVPFNSPPGFKLSITVRAEVRSSLHVKALNMPKQILLLIKIFIADSTGPVLATISVCLAHTLLLDEGFQLLVGNEH